VVDETLLRDVPAGTHVYRTPALEFERFEHRLADLFGGKAKPESAAANAQPATNGRARPLPAGRGIVGALRSTVHRRLLVPDAQIAWLPGALLHSLMIARREGVRLIYTTSPPNSVQLLGGLLAALLRLPWVADFRDPWTDGMRRQKSYVDNALRERFERRAERFIVRRANRVIVSAEPLRERFLRKYPFLSAAKVEVLTNGFDPADFTAPDGDGRELERGRFHLTGTGNIEAMFDLRPLLRAIAELRDEQPAMRADLLVNLVGAKKTHLDDVRAFGLTDVVRYTDWVPHARSLRYLQQSDVLLMCAITQPSGRAEKFPAKAFEYLYVRKPILCLSAPGTVTELLTASGLGTVIAPDDVAGMKQALATCYATRHDPRRGDAAFIERFDRRRLTARLASIFDDLEAG
jgi:glycosyltransferase involved in cell wall biosynthesis